MRKVTVGKREEGLQLLKLLTRYLQKAPQAFFYKMLRKKNITLNGKKAEGKEKLTAGDEICLFLSDETIRLFGGELLLAEREEKESRTNKESSQTKQRELPFGILYEDEDILLMNKPAGLLTQKARPEDISLNEYMLQYLLDSGSVREQELALYKPGVCNRLDRNTSGIVTAGKTIAGAQFLSEALRERTVHKLYECIVEGRVTKAASVVSYIHKDSKENKATVISADKMQKNMEKNYEKIVTAYRPLCCIGQYTYLEVELITGKTHQIRAQMAAQGFPLLGDVKYGGPTNIDGLSIRYQLLHAKRLVFGDTPVRFAALKNRTFEAPLPELFVKLLRHLGVTEKQA